MRTTILLLLAGGLAGVARPAEPAPDALVLGIANLAQAGSWEAAQRFNENLLKRHPDDPRLLRYREALRLRLVHERGQADPGAGPAVGGPLAKPPPADRRPVEGRDFTTATAGIGLVWIASGTFLMSAAHGSDNDTRVTLSRGFWLGQTEVTQEQWQGLMENIPVPSWFKGSRRPVERVSWVSAMEFCQKLNERERAADRLPEGYGYTLPTEAQWEYACRAGTSGPFAGDPDALAWHRGNSGLQTRDVGTRAPNAWGLHDMHGNVMEWCRDGYTGYPGGAVTDLWLDYSGPSAATFRIVRGGAWGNPIGLCRSNFRYWYALNYTGSGVGFRVALVATATLNP